MSATSIERVEAVVSGALREFVEDDIEIRRDSTFDELAIDSLDIVEVRQLIIEELGVQLTKNDLANITTFGELCDLVAGRLS